MRRYRSQFRQAGGGGLSICVLATNVLGRGYHSPSLRRGRIVPPPQAQSIVNEPGEQGTGNGARAIGDAVQERWIATDKRPGGTR